MGGNYCGSACSVDRIVCIVDRIVCIVDRIVCIVDRIVCIVDRIVCIVDRIVCIVDRIVVLTGLSAVLTGSCAADAYTVYCTADSSDSVSNGYLPTESGDQGVLVEVRNYVSQVLVSGEIRVEWPQQHVAHYHPAHGERADPVETTGGSA